MKTKVYIEKRVDWTLIDTQSLTIEKLLKRELSFLPPGAVYSEAYENGWDGRISLYKKKNIKGRWIGSVPAGLTDRALEIIDSSKINTEIIIDDFLLKHEYSTTHFCGELRPEYQIPAVEIALEKKRGNIFAPPRSGKTIMAAAMISQKFTPGTLFIVERLILLQQTIDKFKQFLPKVNIGRAGGGIIDIQDVTVMTIQTLMSAYRKELKSKSKFEDDKKFSEIDAERIREFNEEVKFVLVDEVHNSTSASYSYILEKQKNREYLIGLSGTPWVTINDPKNWKEELRVGENLQLESVIGPVIYQVSYETLLECGYLVPPICYFIRIPKPRGMGRTYEEIYANYVVSSNSIRNKVTARIASNYVEKGNTVLIVVSKLEHGYGLEKMIPNSKFLHGTDPEVVRQEALKLLSTKEIPCIISTLLGEGTDMPSLNVTINASGGKSSQKCLQQQRQMTAYGEKETCIYIDFFDKVSYLEDHSRFRYEFLSSVPGFTVRIIEAPNVN